jgi:membrane associated rhomboid family serine protease
MLEEKRKFINSIKFPLLFLFIITLVDISGYLFNVGFVQFGIFPRTLTGLVGILTAPLIHSNIEHLYSNAVPIFVLGTSIFYFYPTISKKVTLIVYFTTNILVWIFARESYHIGASGIVYGLFSFLFFSGIFRKDKRIKIFITTQFR